jgi:hypothetical protein
MTNDILNIKVSDELLRQVYLNEPSRKSNYMTYWYESSKTSYQN